MKSFDNFTGTINRYMVIKTWMSLGTGVLVTIWLAILRVDYPVLWGLLAFMFNYVPNIGSIIAAVPAILLAFIQLGTTTAILAALGYIAFNVIIGNVIEPRFMGRGLGLSTLVVFLSLIFWGWVLGPVGMVLSIPLTMTMKIGLSSKEETRWISTLLGAASLQQLEREETE
jgi:predicted PurR-regulated permease PerM